VDNIKLGLKKLCWEGADWTELAQGTKDWLAIVKAVMNLRVSKYGVFLGWLRNFQEELCCMELISYSVSLLHNQSVFHVRVTVHRNNTFM
jgi:hypothetical protein